MQCSEIKEYLYEYQTNRLDETARKEVDAHIETCSACRQELEELKVDLKLLELAMPPELPADFKDRAMRKIEQQKVIPFYRKQAYKYVLQGTVAAVVILAVAVTFIIKSTQQKQGPVVRGEKTALVTAECAKAVELYNKGTSTQDLQAKEQFFKDALACICTDNKILAQIHNNLADCYESQGKLDEAVETYNTAITLDKEIYTAYLGLGDISKKQNKIRDAIRYYEKALVIMHTASQGKAKPEHIEEIREELRRLKEKTEG